MTKPPSKPEPVQQKPPSKPEPVQQKPPSKPEPVQQKPPPTTKDTLKAICEQAVTDIVKETVGDIASAWKDACEDVVVGIMADVLEDDN